MRRRSPSTWPGNAPDEVTEAMNAVVDRLQEPTDPFVMAASQRALRRSDVVLGR